MGKAKKKHLRTSTKGKVFPAGRGTSYSNEKRFKRDKEIKDIKDELNELIFPYPEKQDQTDPEVLTIVILKEKAHYFDFLKGYTKWGAKGRWETLDENNIILEIQFKDTKQEKVGLRIKTLLGRYNKLVVKEDLLYFRTVPVEETSL